MFTLVTGATSDIGRQICATLEASGHSLLMTDLDEGALQEARSGLQHPGKHRILPLDLSEVERAGELLSNYLVREQSPVSHAVFAAGLFAVKPLRMADYAFVKRSFDVALFSAVELTRVLTSKKADADHRHERICRLWRSEGFLAGMDEIPRRGIGPASPCQCCLAGGHPDKDNQFYL